MAPRPPTPGALRRALERPLDAASLGVFRIGFGAVLAVNALTYLASGRVDRYWVLPLVRFPYEWLTWLPTLPPAGFHALFWLLAAAGVALAVGWHARAAALVYGLGYSYCLLLDQTTYNNHIYLICLLALTMAVVPASAAFSLDARRRRHRDGEAVPAWALALLRFHVALPYVFGGLAKLNADWLLRAEPMRTWLTHPGAGELRWGWMRHEWAAYAFSWGGLVFDLAIVPALLWRPTRRWALAAAVAFHLTNVLIFDIGVFPWLMIWATLLFLPPDWPRRARFAPPRRRPLPAAPAAAPGLAARAAAALLAAYLALQVLLPFRHVLYPGWVDWTEEGHQFSWRMKLRDKRGELRFVAVDPAGGGRVELTGVEEVLTPTQRGILRHDPELIRQLAHRLQEGLGTAGLAGHRVRVISDISLNGRPRQPLVDPEVDLGLEPPARGAARWIVPLAER